MFAHDSFVFVTNPPGTFWPSESQELLLVAALADPPAAVAAWQALRPRISIDELEFGSFELLPLIYRNLGLAGHDDVDLPRLKGIHRRTWVRNNMLVERTKATSKALSDDGLRGEFVEGAMLALRFYDELGLRPTSLVDVLVDVHDGAAALAALGRAGWSERGSSGPGRGGVRYVFDEAGNACVLRTTLAVDLTRHTGNGRASAWLWETGEHYGVGEADIPVPPPTETFFAVCVLHARAGSLPNVQWIVDAKMALRADIDWPRLVTLAQENGQALRVRDALGVLNRLPGPRPPQDARDRLAAARVGTRERLSYRCTTGSIRGLGGLPALVAEHVASTADRSVLGTVAAFPGFLRDQWNLAHTWHVPFAAGKRAIALLGPRRNAA
jgi:Uncharacterised nucleotidyltransferase